MSLISLDSLIPWASFPSFPFPFPSPNIIITIWHSHLALWKPSGLAFPFTIWGPMHPTRFSYLANRFYFYTPFSFSSSSVLKAGGLPSYSRHSELRYCERWTLMDGSKDGEMGRRDVLTRGSDMNRKRKWCKHPLHHWHPSAHSFTHSFITQTFCARYYARYKEQRWISKHRSCPHWVYGLHGGLHQSNMIC